jgi:hypothetical protein
VGAYQYEADGGGEDAGGHVVTRARTEVGLRVNFTSAAELCCWLERREEEEAGALDLDFSRRRRPSAAAAAPPPPSPSPPHSRHSRVRARESEVSHRLGFCSTGLESCFIFLRN